jgi:uncharacterized protein YdeI (YjbR/CyaY-like superfamily)
LASKRKPADREEATYFSSPAEFRRWLEVHHATAPALWVGFHKRATGKPSLTWPESVDEALCFGWIDGLRQRVDDERYRIRFTPRRAASIWSGVNIRRMGELLAAGRVAPAGLAAWEKRVEAKSAIYAYEQRGSARLAPGDEKRFRSHRAAWSFFAAQPPGYRRLMAYRVISAKREETRRRRLDQLIEACARGERMGILKSESEPKSKPKSKPKAK